MKKHLLIVAAILIGAGFSVPAQAALVGSVDTVALFSNPNASTSISLWTVLPTSVTQRPAILADTGFSVYEPKLGYFTDAVGIRRQNLKREQTEPITERAGTFSQVHGGGDTLLINNPTTKRAFLYNIKTKKSIPFTPRVGLVTSGEFARDGKVLAMIAKNMAGKTKLFLSQGNAMTVRQFDLPKIATACSDVTVSPQATMLALICETSLGDAVFTSQINGQTLGGYQRRVSNTFLPHSMVWLSERRLVVGGYDISGILDISDVTNLDNVVYRQYVVNSRGRVTNVLNTDLDVNVLNPYPSSTLGTDFQLQRRSDREFYYNYSYLGGVTADANADPVYGSIIGHYDVSTKTNTVLVNDGLLNILLERPNPAP